MATGENVNEIPFFEQVSWEDQPGSAFIADIPQLGIVESQMGYVGQGKVVEHDPASQVRTLASAGFGLCAALILRNTVKDSWTFAHAQPFDEGVYFNLRDRDCSTEDALFIFGSQSVHQYDLNQLLASKGAKVRDLRVDTGEAHFGVALDVDSGQVSVVRKTPDHSIFRYLPF